MQEPEKSFLYVIAASENGPVKLGMSGNPERRLKQLQTGHAERLNLYHAEPVPEEKARIYERLLHKNIGHNRTHGEWFNITTSQAINYILFTLIEYEPSDLYALAETDCSIQDYK